MKKSKSDSDSDSVTAVFVEQQRKNKPCHQARGVHFQRSGHTGTGRVVVSCSFCYSLTYLLTAENLTAVLLNETSQLRGLR